jgi:hemerythrin-like domain-containing protein
MQSILARLHTDHANMSSLLDIFENELAKIEQAEDADFEIMRDVLRYLTRYSDAVHHPAEDLVYARLADRSPKARRELAPIPEAHTRIEQESRAILEAVNQIADGGMALRAEIVKIGQRYVTDLRSHIALEEKHLFPMAKQFLDDDDLEAVQKVLDENKDPVFGEVVEADFRDLYDHIQHERQ